MFKIGDSVVDVCLKKRSMPWIPKNVKQCIEFVVDSMYKDIVASSWGLLFRLLF